MYLYTPEEIEQIVIMERLHLYNWGLPCGAKAIRRELDQEGIEPLPSISTIKRILSRNCITHGRTGYYPEDDIGKRSVQDRRRQSHEDRERPALDEQRPPGRSRRDPAAGTPAEQRPIIEVAKEMTDLDQHELRRLLGPGDLTRGGNPG
ncbi:hypothetical protein D1BOALGB6SA_4845 [Olavius sp. associated proteobacterium Delta 1]|nr:hypothetical protein D1BOALGB6SA_4845 [Olavius sp. associated proteobacterium Delta 1]